MAQGDLPPGVHPNEPLTMADLPIITQEIQRKVSEDPSRVQFGMVSGVNYSEGIIPYASVHLDDAKSDAPLTIPSLFAGAIYAGLRVAVMWDPPHQAYIIGVGEIPKLPIGRITLNCSSGGSG